MGDFFLFLLVGWNNMVYHSGYNEAQCRQMCNMSILPLKTKFKGPAPLLKEEGQPDIVDEALKFFKANVLFRNYEVKGPADLVLLYLTYYTKLALKKIENCSKQDAEKALYQLAIENFQIPGDSGFVFGGFFHNPTGRQEADTVRAYFTQLRQELGIRLVNLSMVLMQVHLLNGGFASTNVSS